MNKYKYVVVSGCSFSSSDNPNLVNPGETYGDLIAEHLGAKFYNLSMGGASLQYMNRKTLEWCSRNTDKFEDTLIIFTSDHGEMLGENKMWDKFGWMDSAYRIPLIIHDPNLKPQVILNFTESVDLAPTIIEWIGSDVPINWSGQSLLEYMKNGNDPLAKKYIIFEFDFRASFLTTFVKNKVLTPEECNFIGIRNSKWKYIHFPSFPPLLFDLENDPYEMKNLANNKKYIKIINDLLSQLISHRILHQDRQLSSLHISKDGVSSNYGPPSRKLIN